MDEGTSGGILLLTLAQAAERLALSRPTVQRLVANGTLPAVKIGSCRRIALTDLLLFVADLERTRTRSVGSEGQL